MYKGFGETDDIYKQCLVSFRVYDSLKNEYERELAELEIKLKSKPMSQTKPRRGACAGKCPLCGSPLVWRKAKLTGELYRGCTNYDSGCRWHDRSYRSSKSLKEEKVAGVDWEEVLEHFGNKAFLFSDVEKYIGRKYGKLVDESDWKRIVYSVNYNKNRKYEVESKRIRIGNRSTKLYCVMERG